MGVKEEILDKYQSANRAYQNGRHVKAMQEYAELIAFALKNENSDIDIAQCMRRVIEVYRKMGNEGIVAHSDEIYGHNLLDQYFCIIRHYLDHRPVTNLQKIQEEIHRPIPNSVPENGDLPHEEGAGMVKNRRIGLYDCAVASAQGPRETMEDTHLMATTDGTPPLDLFAVFDGHGGGLCAEFSRDNLLAILRKQIQPLGSLDDTGLYNAITRAFILLDEHWSSAALSRGVHLDHSGTTAAVAIIVDHGALWVANVGDSRTVLGQDGVAVQLSEDAKPTTDKFYDEILQRGGDVRWGRVDGRLDMARAIGDLHHPSVSARPTIRKFDLAGLDRGRKLLLIIACDGLWGVVDPQTAVDAAKGRTPEAAAEALRRLAYEKGSRDNVTVMVVNLVG